MMRNFVAVLILAMLAISCAKSDAVTAKPSRANMNSEDEFEINKLPLQLPLSKPRIVVIKSMRRLMLYSGDKLVRRYRVGLGLSPVEDKVKEGDRRTPEGNFYVFVKNEKSAFYLSLGLSYPNIEDAERGLRDGLINRTQL